MPDTKDTTSASVDALKKELAELKRDAFAQFQKLLPTIKNRDLVLWAEVKEFCKTRLS